MGILACNSSGGIADGFRCGIGIATGRAVAGRIGTVDQVKVTAFGPVVNLASRLEGLTKSFGAEVIIDEATATAIGDRCPEGLRIRRLARVRPTGSQKVVEVSELLGQADHADRSLTDQQIQDYEASLDALIEGNWDEAHRRLHDLPAWDRAKDVLIATILKHNRAAPDNWDGVIDPTRL
jgi:adenylate cyclase